MIPYRMFAKPLDLKIEYLYSFVSRRFRDRNKVGTNQVTLLQDVRPMWNTNKG